MPAAFAFSIVSRASAMPPTTRRMAQASASASPSRRQAESQETSARPAKRLKAPEGIASQILAAEREMSDALGKQKFGKPVTHVYNPLEYAWDAHEWYVRKYGDSTKEVLLVGMNPGPWGMAQTGVPFGEVRAVREFLKLPADTEIGKPLAENAARPVGGLECGRSEVSGRRLWLEWARAEYGTADAFFRRFFVHNYCPLLFLEGSGKNRTPVQLRKAERDAVTRACDEGLRAVVRALRPRVVCGVGGFAEQRCNKALAALGDDGPLVAGVLHPSPASPAANRGWAEQARAQIEEVLQRADGGA